MAIGAMHVAAWHEAYPHLLSEASWARITPAGRGRRWVETLSANTRGIWVAETQDGEIIGHASAVAASEDAPRPLELQSIYILAKAYGSGAGQGLLDAAIGDHPACLWVAELNPRAQAFYRRNGFEVAGEPVIRPFILDHIAELRMVR